MARSLTFRHGGIEFRATRSASYTEGHTYAADTGPFYIDAHYPDSYISETLNPTIPGSDRLGVREVTQTVSLAECLTRAINFVRPQTEDVTEGEKWFAAFAAIQAEDDANFSDSGF